MFVLIPSAAYLVVCRCGFHGHIVFADGEHSSEFTSKDQAERAAIVAIGGGKMSEVEFLELERQIRCCCLPDDPEQLLNRVMEMSAVFLVEERDPFSAKLN